jgi:hypothetical protein
MPCFVQDFEQGEIVLHEAPLAAFQHTNSRRGQLPKGAERGGTFSLVATSVFSLCQMCLASCCSQLLPRLLHLMLPPCEQPTL